MKFEYDGREFDTDKPICVLGYCIEDSWYAYDVGDIHDKTRIGKYSAQVKKFYVKSLNFRRSDGRNKVDKIIFDTSGRRKVCVGCGGKYLIGRSPKECMKLYRERCGGTED